MRLMGNTCSLGCIAGRQKKAILAFHKPLKFKFPVSFGVTFCGCVTMNDIVDQIFEAPEEWLDQVLYTSRDGRATYGETRDAMLRVSAWLRERHSVRAGDQVAVCLPVAISSVQIILGILASGASYLPLEFNGPPLRLNQILFSSNSHILLTTEGMANKLQPELSAAQRISIVPVDLETLAFSRLLKDFPPLAMPVAREASDIAAIFFTSGSTGEPKGVMMSYASMADTAGIYAKNVPLRSDDRLIMLAPLHYAASLGLFFPYTAGCRSYIVSEAEAMFPELVGEILERERITLWEAAATRLRLLVEGGSLNARDLRSMRYIAFYGERMPMDSLRNVMQFFPNAEFQNTYAASEVFWMMRFTVPRPIPDDLELLPIGKPRKDFTVILCDAEGQEVLAGDVGEICIIGPVGLVGYWNRPDLTAAARLNGISSSYRTGDLARLGGDGNYYFAGRRDHQVKIRGHRFELGEIETVLKSHAEVREAVAFLASDKIHACVLAENREGLTGEIRAICARRLPVFARPQSISVVGKFPQLPSGKVDRIKLEKSVKALSRSKSTS
jgi:yersiniabactin nonribosomal peptide synthetase